MSEKSNLNQNENFISLPSLLESDNRIALYNQILKSYQNTKNVLSRKTLPKIIEVLKTETSKKNQNLETLLEASEDLQIALNLIQGINHQSYFLQMSIDENDNSNLTAKIEHKEYELILVNNDELNNRIEKLIDKQNSSQNARKNE